jgi:SPP1 family predicted phage head-tail adaptor
MRAGRLDQTIFIQRVSTDVNAAGTPVETWSTVMTLRAQIMQGSTEEFLSAAGAEAQTATVFRIWYCEGLRLSDRVAHGDRLFDIKELREIGRRAGLDIRAVARAEDGGP